MATSLAVGIGQVGVGVAVGAAISRNYIGYTAQGDAVADRAITMAAIDSSTINVGSGSISVSATSSGQINAQVIAGAGAAAAGQVGLALSGAGVSVENRINATTTARVTGSTASLSAGTVSVQAANSASIDAVAGAVAFSIAGGMVGISGAIAATIAVNTISSTTSSQIIRNADSGAAGVVSATTGALNIGAADTATIRSRAASVALAAGFGVGGIAVSGAGADSSNAISTLTNIRIESMNISGQTGIVVSANGAASIDAKVMSAAASLAVGAVGIGISVGASLARNDIGGAGRGVIVGLTGATLSSAAGNIAVDANMTSTIRALVEGFALAVAGGIVAGAGAGSGATATNTLHYAVSTSADGSSFTATTGRVTIKAKDTSDIDATVRSASIAGSVGLGGAMAVSVSLASADISNTITASLHDTDVIAAALDVVATDAAKALRLGA